MYGVDTRGRQSLDPEVSRVFDAFEDAYQWEALRQAIRRALRVYGGQRAVASMIGVGRTVLRKFLAMRTIPERENRRKLFDWLSDRPEVPPRLEAVCAAVLVDNLLPEVRAAARMEMCLVLKRFFEQGRQPVPKWLQAELKDEF
jgi:hypothetical protein